MLNMVWMIDDESRPKQEAKLGDVAILLGKVGEKS